MKKRAMTLGLALFCAFLLCGCQRTTPAAPAQEAAPEPEAAEETVLLLGEPVPAEPEPEPEPEPFAAGEELLLFGTRMPTLTDGEALYVKAEELAACAQLSCVVTEDGVMLRWDGREELFPISRRDQLQPGDAFLQDGAAYVEACLAAERFGFVSGEAEDGTTYFAKQLTLDTPAENVNVPVLMYHAVSHDLWGYWDLFVSPETMEQELLYLQENGYETIWFEDLSHVEDFEKPVILTFDDGYDDNYTELFPLLQKYNAKATIFVIPKAIGTPHKMTAEQVQELSRSGLVSIQSHTYSHGNLSTMDEQTLIFEMEQSQNYLAALTGQVPYAVCYPEGTRSELSIEVAGRYYDYGLLMNGQLYNTSDDPMRVKRFYVPRGYDLGSFRWSVQDAGTSRNW